MSTHNAADNNALFDYSAPRHNPEASRSWWMEQPTREAFQAAAIRERLRMSRSRESRHVSSTFILGHVGRTK